MFYLCTMRLAHELNSKYVEKYCTKSHFFAVAVAVFVFTAPAPVRGNHLYDFYFHKYGVAMKKRRFNTRSYGWLSAPNAHYIVHTNTYIWFAWRRNRRFTSRFVFRRPKNYTYRNFMNLIMQHFSEHYNVASWPRVSMFFILYLIWAIGQTRNSLFTMPIKLLLHLIHAIHEMNEMNEKKHTHTCTHKISQ